MNLRKTFYYWCFTL